MNVYTAAGDGHSNEELAVLMQRGDGQAAESLVLQNEGYITELALKHVEWCDLDDLKQEGTLALLEAAKRFDLAYGTKLLTYATPAITAAMTDYCAHTSLPLSIPPSRYHQLRRVGRVCSEMQDKSDPALIGAICKELEASPRAAAELLKDYRTLFHVQQLGDDVFTICCGGDPAKAYDRHMRQTLLLQLMEEVLKPRELNLVRCYLGIGMPNEKGMTFQELAIRLNYNGPSSAEKAYKSTLCKLKRELYSAAYGRWISVHKTIRKAKAEAESCSGCCTTPQTTWSMEENWRSD